MLPIRINLLLFIFVTLLFSCNTETKETKISSEENIIKSQSQISENSIENNIPVSAKRKIVDHFVRKDKRLHSKNFLVNKNLIITKKPSQIFNISANRDTTLTGGEGTVIGIKQRSFVYTGTNIDVAGVVTFYITEYYKLSDILLANLSTQSSGRLLETGGMIFIEAMAEGRQCDLKKNSTIEIQFPYSERKEGMRLFAGRVENEKVNWDEVDTCTNLFYACMEDQAQFPGGNEALIKFISNNIKYPDSLYDRGLSGRVSARFEINEYGKATFLKIIEPTEQAFTQTMRNVFLKMPLWKPAIQNGRPIRSQMIQPVIFFYEGETFDTTYKRKFEEQMEDDTSLNRVSTCEIGKYVFSSSNLGWINCDRFYNDNRQKLDLFVKVDDYDELDIKLVFHSFKSILTGELKENSYQFRKVPIDEKITVVAVARRKERNFVALGDYNTNSGVIDNLIFQQVTPDGLKDTLKKLDPVK